MIDDSDLIIWALLWTMFAPPLLWIVAHNVSMIGDEPFNVSLYFSLLLMIIIVIIGTLVILLVPSITESIRKQWVLGVAAMSACCRKGCNAIKSPPPAMQTDSLEDSFSFPQSSDDYEETSESSDEYEVRSSPSHELFSRNEWGSVACLYGK
jgi:hypothetical protein